MIFKDQLGREVELCKFPQRIVSLVPSQTHLLVELGLGDRVIGITKFCIHPKTWSKTKTKVGGTKNVNIDKIISLQPDIIIGNKEENTKEDIEKLAALFPVWISDINSVSESLQMIEQVSEMLDCKQIGKGILDKIENALTRRMQIQQQNSVLYLIWKKPWMSINKNTYIFDLLMHFGLQPIEFNSTERYPKLSEEMLAALNPSLILLSSEPFPFKQKDIETLQRIVPHAKVLFIDGESCSWYGSFLLKSIAYLNTYIVQNNL